MSVKLCIDWGNTNLKAGIFDNKTHIKTVVYSEHNYSFFIKKLLDDYRPNVAVLCSVIEHPYQVEDLLKQYVPHYFTVTGTTKTPIRNAYSSPETLGADRLALVSAAGILHPGKNSLVICAGTCITYNFVTNTQTFRGGAISPGLKMRLQAMNQLTSKLPLAELEIDSPLIGYDTVSCLQSGAWNGLLAEVDGIIQSYESKYPDFNAILTGGDAPFLAGKLKSKIFADPDLLLKGLNIILDHNVPSAH
ncbi:MAG: type III pantothenate kinase [Chitinophagia bacterium]|nr:type III pantothenate kinase [Chitinophagia bacterium]